MKTTRLWLLAVLVAGLMAPVWALPQTSATQEMSAQDRQMMEMMEKYATPGKDHELLKKFVGEWNVEIKSWMEPEGTPFTSQGTMKSKLIFDGRYVKLPFRRPDDGPEVYGPRDHRLRQFPEEIRHRMDR